jgi:energy-coupling factor transporter ATP-binding protein EcfA2
MGILQDIYSWSLDLPLWQRDALRRLLLQEALEEGDFTSLYTLLRAEHGISDPEAESPQPLDGGDLPAALQDQSGIIIRRLRDLKHVNRIVEGQVLEFAAGGITVIYGDNGTGKSGYSRVLKRACRARDQGERVLPNVFMPTGQQGTPECAFDIKVAGVDKVVHWKNDTAAPEELSAISVFDSRCARAYVTEQQDVAYMPYGLDIVENLAQKVAPELLKRVERDIAACVVDTTLFQDLQVSKTSVGRVIEALSAETKIQDIQDLSSLSAAEEARLDDLRKTLKAENPKARAESIRKTVARLASLQTRVNQVVDRFNADFIAKLKSLDETTRAAEKAEEIALQNFHAGEKLLPGTGGKEWQALFEAARRFSTVAYPKDIFPAVVDDTKCVLCQQDLHDGGARLQRFDNFVKQEATKAAVEKRKQLHEMRKKLPELSLDFGIDDALRDEIAQLEPTLIADLNGLLQALTSRRTSLIAAFVTHEWSTVTQIPDGGRSSLATLHSRLTQEIRNLLLAADDAARRDLESEFEELQARVKLRERKKAVVATVEKLVLKKKLESARKALNTRRISDKAKQLTQKAITEALRDALNREFKELNVGHLQVRLSDRAQSGKTYHQLVLDIPGTAKVSDVLSEGKARAIAIASFLAELSLSESTGGAIFDDPVSSLDHFNRERVARRLAREAKRRQIIVFTHDTVFLAALSEAIKEHGIDSKIYHLTHHSRKHSGQCIEGLPWHHQGYKDRIDQLEKRQRALAKVWIPNTPTDEQAAEMRQLYGHFRATLERVVQDVVFNDVIRRYRDWIKVERLEDVIGFSRAEYDEIARLDKTASGVLDSHDPSSIKNAPLPEPAQLKADIQALSDLIEVIKPKF